MTYDKNRDVLWLLDKVVIHNQPDEKGEGGADIEAGAAGLARADKYMRFERGVKIVRNGQTISADAGVAYLTPDEKRIQMLELRGSSRVSGVPKADGGLRNMAARDINLTYAEDGKTLQRAVLSGDGVIDLAGAAGSAGRRLSGRFIDIGLGPDGSVVTALLAREQVVLDLFADKTTPARTIKSGALQGTGTPEGRLDERARSTRAWIFAKRPRRLRSRRVARSSTMDLALKNGFSSIESAQFSGGVQFEQGTMTASSREARYGIAAGTLEPVGRGREDGTPAAGRRRTGDDRGEADRHRTRHQPDHGGRVGEDGDARPPAAAGRSGNKADGRHRPAMLKPDKPVYATADNLVYDSSSSHAVYTGNAQLWQGETRIKADKIVVDDQTGNLHGVGQRRLADDPRPGERPDEGEGAGQIGRDRQRHGLRRLGPSGHLHRRGPA